MIRISPAVAPSNGKTVVWEKLLTTALGHTLRVLYLDQCGRRLTRQYRPCVAPQSALIRKGAAMNAKDIMSTRVVTADEETPIETIAEFLIKFHISAVPVIDDANRVIGMVSEGDLMRRSEIGTEKRQHSWWLDLLVERPDLAREFVKSHGTRAGDVMTRKIITVDEDTPIEEIAEILEKNQIKRVPVLRDGRLVGLVSRGNIIQQLACGRKIKIAVSKDDAVVRTEIEKLLAAQPWASSQTTAVTVTDGAVELWGFIGSTAERDASRVALESISGIKSVEDHRSIKTGMQISAH